MKLFHKQLRGTAKLFNKNTESHNAFHKFVNRARQHEQSKGRVGNFIANTTRRNDLEREVRRHDEAERGHHFV